MWTAGTTGNSIAGSASIEQLRKAAGEALTVKKAPHRPGTALLIFFNPQCGFCTKMAADLAALSAEGGDGRAVPVVVTTGDASHVHHPVRIVALEVVLRQTGVLR